MSDQFLAIPDQMIGATLFPQEAVDWLAFGPPEQGLRSSLSLDDQILCAHTAAGVLLMAMWDDSLPGYVRSPSVGSWYQVPSLYWGRQASDSIQSATTRPEIPDRLPAQPRPLDPRYEIELAVYPHPLPAGDLVGQVVAYRRAEVERYCSIAKPVCQWKPKTPAGEQWSLYQAVAWVATNDDDFAQQQAILYESHRLPKLAGAVTWLALQQALKDREPDRALMSADDARRILSSACEAGKVAASGLAVVSDNPRRFGERQPIPAIDFVGVELWPGEGGSLHRIIQGRGEAGRWFELRFSETDLRDIASGSSSVSKQPSKPMRASPVKNAGTRPAQWTEQQMTEEIAKWVAQTSSRDREVAWRDHFRGIRSEHGWSNQAFRDHWATANGSVGKPGRPNPAH